MDQQNPQNTSARAQSAARLVNQVLTENDCLLVPVMFFRPDTGWGGSVEVVERPKSPEQSAENQTQEATPNLDLGKPDASTDTNAEAQPTESLAVPAQTPEGVENPNPAS